MVAGADPAGCHVAALPARHRRARSDDLVPLVPGRAASPGAVAHTARGVPQRAFAVAFGVPSRRHRWTYGRERLLGLHLSCHTLPPLLGRRRRRGYRRLTSDLRQFRRLLLRQAVAAPAAPAGGIRRGRKASCTLFRRPHADPRVQPAPPDVRPPRGCSRRWRHRRASEQSEAVACHAGAEHEGARRKRRVRRAGRGRCNARSWR